MLALLQRVLSASVQVDNKTIGSIKQGVLAFIGVEKNDSDHQANRLLERILGYRIFSDKKGSMNLSIEDINGGLLLVPQFTLAADTKKGMRPSFTPAAPPEEGERLFEHLVARAQTQYSTVETGTFGAYMQVELCNDGPVTLLLQVK